VNLIRAQKTRYCYLLVGLVAVASYAQEPVSPSSATSSENSSKQASAGSNHVILKVGDLQVTKEEFESRIKAIEGQGGDPEKAGASVKNRRRLGDDYASVLMLSQQAVANHLESSPEVSRQLAIARMQVLSDAEFAALMSQAKPTSEEVSQYYSAHLSDYDVVQIRRLFIWKHENSKDKQVLSPEAARARAEQILHEYKAGTSEKTLAADLMKSGEGMLDTAPLTFTRGGGLSPEMEKVAFALKEGEWSEAEDTPVAALLIQLVKRDRRQLGEVRPRIEKTLQDDKMQTQLEDLKKKAGIWMDEQYFGTAAARVPGAQGGISNPQPELKESAQKQESAQKGERNNEDQRQK